MNNQPVYNRPSIESEDIAKHILNMLQTFENTNRIKAILEELIQPPAKIFVDTAIQNLNEINAIKDHKITDVGLKLSKLPLEPKLGICLLVAQHYGVLNEVLTIACMLEVSMNIEDFLIMIKKDVGGKIKSFKPAIWDKIKNKQSQHISLLNLYNQFNDYTPEQNNKAGINVQKMITVKNQYKILKQRIDEVLPFKPVVQLGGSPNNTNILKCLCYGFRKQVVDFNDNMISYLGQNIKIYDVELKGTGKMIFSELVIMNNKNYNFNIISVVNDMCKGL